MVCKYCGAFMEDDQNICPLCGGAQNPEEPVPETDPMEETLRVPAGEEATAEQTEDAGQDTYTMTFDQPETDPEEEDPAGETETAPAKKPKRASGVLLAALILVALAALTVAVLGIFKFTKGSASDEDPTAFSHVDEEGNFIEHAYTKEPEEVTEEMVNTVVATCGDAQLTNGMLSFYYWQQYYNLLNSYGSYIAYILDTEQPLSSQMYDQTHTWEDMLLQAAVNAFWQNTAVENTAKEAGYQLDESSQTYLDSMADTLDEEAQTAGFDSMDAYIQNFYGPYTTAADYQAFVDTSFLVSSYLNERFQEITYTEDDITNYFKENTETYAEQGLSIDDPKMVNVRHILIKPVADENAETDESGAPVLTEQNWTDAKLKAEEIYEMWKSGEATEDSFAELAGEYSEDPGSVSTGGLYEEVYPGEMVEAFDAARQPGDTGIVETDYGYHIMYFSGTADHAYWYQVAEQDYVNDQRQAMIQEMRDANPIEVDYDKVVLMKSEAM